MSLENRLAEIQVKAKEIRERSRQGHLEGLDTDWARIGNYSRGIVHEAEIVYSALSGKSEEKAGEFAMALKNLADNVNGLVQSIYNPKDNQVSFAEISQLSRVPFVNGESIVDLFLRVHDNDGEVVKLRNKKGHARGHEIAESKNPEEIKDWMNKKAEEYLQMTSDILESVAANERYRLSEREGYKPASVSMQRLRNWFTRHKTTAAVGLGSAAFMAGVLGTLFVKDLVEKNREIYEGNEIRNLVLVANVANTDFWAASSHVDKDRFNHTLKEIRERSNDLGNKLDNYSVALSQTGLLGGLDREYSDFMSSREDFRNHLNYVNSKINGLNYKNQIDTINELSSLLVKERILRKKESYLLKMVLRVPSNDDLKKVIVSSAHVGTLGSLYGVKEEEPSKDKK
ncbi:MAG TPA: hypothetical protein VHA12_03110 [Candidatus Nanoarchaeia archaeon]|nr:hypothetical protein [Candidatus Nanoarchaeia archaeon]